MSLRDEEVPGAGVEKHRIVITGRKPEKRSLAEGGGIGVVLQSLVARESGQDRDHDHHDHTVTKNLDIVTDPLIGLHGERKTTIPLAPGSTALATLLLHPDP
jgi:hypothetical protein